MKKRILSLVLAFLFVFALTAPASAIVDVYHEVSITNVPIPNEGSLYPGTAGISTSHGTVQLGPVSSTSTLTSPVRKTAVTASPS